MELLETAKKRFSVRSYTDQKVEPEKLNKILEAAHVAPTAANLQPLIIQNRFCICDRCFYC